VSSSAEVLQTGEQPLGESPGEELTRLRARIRELEGAATRDDRTDALLSMLSHELRSPLQSLLLNIDLCLQRVDVPGGEPGGPWLADKLLRQRRMAGRLKLLIDTFLDVGQLASGQLSFETEEIDLGELVGDIVRRGGDELAWAHCPCTVMGAPGVVGHWDRLQLELLVTNLLSNAMKYGAGAPIDISIWGTPELAFVRVADQGPGIDPADHERIFDKFTRLPNPSHVGGFGLGLWIARSIVEAQGGSIAVDSTLGRGAAFTVVLPLARPAAAA
jgi:two-component system OmpR family sensor kinase